MDYKKTVSTVLGEVEALLKSLDDRDVEDLTRDILDLNKTFVMGAGRAMFLSSVFVKRLSQIGIDAHVIGGTTAPPVGSGDLLIVASNSGATVTPIAVAEKARQTGAKIWGITSSEGSPLARYCDRVLLIPCVNKGQGGVGIISVQPLNNLFEQVLHLLFDYMTWALQEAKGLSEGDIWKRHANIE